MTEFDKRRRPIWQVLKQKTNVIGCSNMYLGLREFDDIFDEVTGHLCTLVNGNVTQTHNMLTW